MWNIEILEELGLNFDPARNEFTYHFPLAGYCKAHGVARRPSSLSTSRSWEDFSLYVHVPFCKMDCAFCTCHHVTNSQADRIQRYLGALDREIRALGPSLQSVPLKSIYFGGGTPTMLAAAQLHGILDAIAETFTLAPRVEVCFECAPDLQRDGKTWRELLSSLSSRGTLALNRISVGVQSLDPGVLGRMRRKGGPEAIVELLGAVEEIVPTYNLDFLFGFPEEITKKSVAETTSEIAAGVLGLQKSGIRCPSLSLYQMWNNPIEQPSPQRQTMRLLPQHKRPKQALVEAKWALQNELFELGYAPRMHALVRGDEDRHDWMATKYLEFRQIGVGSGVYSIFPDEFSLRARDVPRYVDESERTEGLIADDTCFALDEAEVCARRLIMGARSFEWFAVPSIPQEGVAPEKRAMYESLMTRLDSLVDCGLFERRGDEVRATPQAYAITNEISSYLSPTSYR